MTTVQFLLKAICTTFYQNLAFFYNLTPVKRLVLTKNVLPKIIFQKITYVGIFSGPQIFWLENFISYYMNILWTKLVFLKKITQLFHWFSKNADTYQLSVFIN